MQRLTRAELDIVRENLHPEYKILEWFMRQARDRRITVPQEHSDRESWIASLDRDEAAVDRFDDKLVHDLQEDFTKSELQWMLGLFRDRPHEVVVKLEAMLAALPERESNTVAELRARLMPPG